MHIRSEIPDTFFAKTLVRMRLVEHLAALGAEADWHVLDGVACVADWALGVGVWSLGFGV